MANQFKANNYQNSGLSKASYLAKSSKSTKSAPILSGSQAKSAASSSVKVSKGGDSKSLAKAQKEYLNSLKPSKDESNALKANQNLLMGQETQGKAIQNTQGNAGNNVALPFIQGQLGALDDKTQAASIPLKYQIAALQSARQARTQVAGAKVNYATQNYNRKISAGNAARTQAHQDLVDQNLQLTINKKLGGGSGTGNSKAYSTALAASQKAILKGTSNREVEAQVLNTRFGKKLNPQDVQADGYTVLKKSKSGK